jgi:hypothetical protein
MRKGNMVLQGAGAIEGSHRVIEKSILPRKIFNAR